MRYVLLKFLFLLCSILSIAHAKAAIDASEFFSNPDFYGARISPDGKHIVAISYENDKQKIIIVDSATIKRKVLFDASEYGSAESSISNLLWIDNSHIGAQYTQVKKGVEDLLDSKISRKLLIFSIAEEPQKPIYSVRTSGWLVNPLSNEEYKFLYAKSGMYSKIYKLDIRQLAEDKVVLGKLDKTDGGQFTKSNEVRSISGYAVRWFFGSEDKPKAVLSYNSKGGIELSVFNENDELSVLKSWDLETNNSKNTDKNRNEKIDKKRLMPIAPADDENSFYCLDVNQENERSVYKVNYKTNTEKLVYETTSYKIIDLILNKKNNLIGALVLQEGAIRYEYFDDQSLGSEEILGKSRVYALISPVSQSLEGKSIIYFESHNNPGEYYLSDEKNENTLYIGSHYPQLRGQLNSKQLKDSVIVEGLKIPFLLTLPGTTANKSPLIVMPHGGPLKVFDHVYFDTVTQYLASQGYAVLRVNFRGSGGHDKALEEAGKKQWGRLMLEDIRVATGKVLAHEEIKDDRACIFGMSYGGYAATMLVIQQPDMFKCAANVAGVSDINLMINNAADSEEELEWLRENVGDPELEHQDLQAISPAYLTHRLQRPLFIHHGEKDNVVDIEHAYRLKIMLEKNGKEFIWSVDPEGEHSYGSPEEASELFNRLTAFFNKYI